jgi:hypothetical protein
MPDGQSEASRFHKLESVAYFWCTASIAAFLPVTATNVEVAYYVFMMFFPAGLFLTIRGCCFFVPFPYFAARLLAASILPPLLFFAMLFISYRNT